MMSRRTRPPGRRRGRCPASGRAARRPRRSARVERQRDQHGALALDEVVTRGLAGRRGVAEHAEQVVAQLEGLAERQAEAPSARPPCPGSAPARAAPMCSGPLDGVLRGLVAQHGHRRVDVGAAAGLHGHVEELAGDHLRAAQVEHLERRPTTWGSGRPQRRSSSSAQLSSRSPSRIAAAAPYCSGSPRQPVARGARLEGAVGRRTAAAGVGGVHVVVVDQGAGVQQLQGGAGPDQRGLVGDLGPDRAVAPVAERRPEPLAAADTERRASSSSRAASSPRGASRLACSSRKSSSAFWMPSRKPARPSLLTAG